MSIHLSNKQKKSLIGFKILKEEDFCNLYIGIYMKFYNLNNNQLSSVRFNRIHKDIIIIGNKNNNEERIFYINKYIIFYKPKISNERKFMENLYNNLKVIKEQ